MDKSISQDLPPDETPTISTTRLPTEEPTVVSTDTPDQDPLEQETETPTLEPPTDAPLIPDDTPSAAPVRLIIDLEKHVYDPGDEFTVYWEVQGWEALPDKRNLTIVISRGDHFSLLDELSTFPATGDHYMNVANPYGQLQFKINGETFDSFPLSFTLHQADQILNRATVVIESAIETEKEKKPKLVNKSGGKVKGLKDKVEIDFPEGALTEDTLIWIKPFEGDLPVTDISGEPFEIIAEGNDSKTIIEKFKKPVTIAVQYDENLLDGVEMNLTLSYFNEDIQGWLKLDSWVDEELNILYAQTSHFTIFDYGAESFQNLRLPTLDSAQVSSFNGAGTYAIPIWVPEGPGGLKPSLMLSYNSHYLNRWLQPDTIIPDPYYPLDFDRYSYVRNNPVRYSDPSGHFTEDEIDKYLQSIGITDADERAKVIAQWKDDDEWWKVIGPGGATYGDVIDGTKLLLGKPYGERIVLKFTKNEKAGTFGIQGTAILWDTGGGGAMSNKRLSDSNFSLVKFHDETSDIIWMRPNSKGNLTYQGGTGYGGDGANIHWEEMGNAIGHSAASFGIGFGGIAPLAAPEPTLLTKALAVSMFIGYGFELLQAQNSANNFSRSTDAASRLYLDGNYSQFIP